jgi:Bacterial PH domain
MADEHEFDYEPTPGLPEALPASERLLWQGAPDWHAFAVDVFHVRKVMIYFVGLAAAAAFVRFADGAAINKILTPFLWLLPMGVVAAGLLAALAWYSARTTLYTITTKRVVMRIGMAFTITINLPFKRIDSAAVKLMNKGIGDLVFSLQADNKLSYIILWPHARRWKFASPQPALRAIPDADRVARLVASAMAGEHVVPLQSLSATTDSRIRTAVAA